MSSVLTLKKISKSYSKGETILKDFDLEVQEGEFLVLVGPSGSGKSTIIRLIAGLEQQDEGEINFRQINIGKLEPKNRKVSMVFQNYALYPHKTVYDNIAFPLNIISNDKKDTNNRVLSIAEKLHIQEYLKRKPKELSGGQRQRVALARAMIKEPEIFLMDEPLSNLDAKLRAQMRHEIHVLHRESKKIFIYVTHDQIEALSLGDRIAVLDKGKIQQIGTPQEIYNNPANTFVAGFIGSPPTNLLKLQSCEPQIASGGLPDDILGLRAEIFDLEPKKSPDTDTGDCLNIDLDNIEMLGREYIIYGRTTGKFSENCTPDSGQLVTAKISATEAMLKLYQSFISGKTGPLNLYYDTKQAYTFSAIDGRRLS